MLQDSAAHDTAASLRQAMIDELRAMGTISTEPVAAAFAAVPRHLFVPGEPLEAVYAADAAVIVKRDPGGATTSCLSAAHIQAVMLEQAEITPGMRVLEIGSGGGNAALIQELAGAAGHVTTVDIDPDVSRSRARRSASALTTRRITTATPTTTTTVIASIRSAVADSKTRPTT